MNGTVIWFSRKKGYGFLRDQEGLDRFFHSRELTQDQTIKAGDPVAFMPGEGEKGPTATRIVKLSTDSVVPISTTTPIMPNTSISSAAPTGVLQEVNNWKIEAKLEDNDRYFYHTLEANLIEDGSRCYVIGRKGTGKTAISEYLHKSVAPTRFTDKLSFKNFPFNDLYKLTNERFTFPNQYITLWKYVIYSSIAQMMIKNESISPGVRRMLRDIYPNDPRQSLPRRVAAWLGGSYKLGLKEFGLEFASARQPVDNDIPWVDRVEVLEDIISEHVGSCDYFILFDELDEDYKNFTDTGNGNQYAALMTSLFKAVQDIRASFPQPKFRIFPVVFLRDDIYNSLTDPDKTKWSDLNVELDWSEVRIRKLLAFRISRAVDSGGPILDFQLAWDKLFSTGAVKYGDRQQKKIATFDFIARATQMRPRDYIRYVQACAGEALARDLREVTPEVVVKVDKAFSNYLRSELEDEVHGILPDIHEILDLISHIRKQVFYIDEFSRAFERQVARGVLSTRDPEFALKMLFHFSIIGNQPRQKNIQVFRYLNKEARLNLSEPISVHRGLFKALQIL